MTSILCFNVIFKVKGHFQGHFRKITGHNMDLDRCSLMMLVCIDTCVVLYSYNQPTILTTPFQLLHTLLTSLFTKNFTTMFEIGLYNILNVAENNHVPSYTDNLGCNCVLSIEIYFY